MPNLQIFGSIFKYKFKFTANINFAGFVINIYKHARIIRNFVRKIYNVQNFHLELKLPTKAKTSSKSLYLLILLGAIFDKENSQKEKAFHLAIEHINRKNQNGPFEYQGLVEHIQYDNSFEALTATCRLMEQGIVGVFGPHSKDNSNTVQSICDTNEIPHIETRWNDVPVNGTIVNVYPHPNVMTRTYLDLLDNWNWEDFVILYENNESLKRVHELLKLYNKKGLYIIVRQLDKSKTGNYRSVRIKIKKLFT